MDGVLVALAYFLAYRLRFDVAAVPPRYEDLFEDTIWWVVPVVLVALAAFGVYQRVWTFVGQRDYEGVVKGVIAGDGAWWSARSRCSTRVQTPADVLRQAPVLQVQSDTVGRCPRA